MSAGGTTEQEEGGKRMSSGSGKMGSFFKLFGKRDSWKQSIEGAQLSLVLTTMFSGGLTTSPRARRTFARPVPVADIYGPRKSDNDLSNM
jgi:hypothetical protein